MAAPWRNVFAGRWGPSQAAGTRLPAPLVLEATLGVAAGGTNYVETASATGDAALAALDAVQRIETATVAGAGAVVVTDVGALVELGVMAGDAAVVGVDTSSVAAPAAVALLAPAVFSRPRGGVVSRGARRWLG